MSNRRLPLAAPGTIRTILLLGAAAVAGTLTACGDDGVMVEEAVCGDGIKQDGEACDDGNSLETDSCTTACVEAACGDGVVQFVNNETCDDGNTDAGDGCSAACLVERCGDGVVTGAETCDDGNAVDTDACRNNCAAPTCGDGVVQVGIEACDDGNASDTDACTTACAAPTCGDGDVQAGEQCDDGNDDDTDACRTNCLAARCGDGVVQGDEQCDDGNPIDSDDCRITCEVARCGDGVVQTGVEECDDANTLNEDSCSNGCTQARCGDGVVQGALGETCDDGDLDDGDACPTTCRVATCGDGLVFRGHEECDDANQVDGDICSSACVANCFPDASRRYVDPATDTCYGVYDADSREWAAAEAHCAQEPRGHLASIGSEAEQQLVADLSLAGEWWIGFNDRDVEGAFAWSDGTEAGFTFWFDGEPNDVDGEDCAEMLVDGWNDLPCDLALPYVCESSPEVLQGVRQNVAPASLAGWSECYVDTYDNTGTPIAAILAQCPGDDLILGCREVGAPTLALAAQGARADVLFDCGTAVDCVHQAANDVGWYFSDNSSWGFAPGGASVNRSSCDYNDGTQAAADRRMCWHTGGGTINSGYRCGDNDLNGGATWERVIYTR